MCNCYRSQDEQQRVRERRAKRKINKARLENYKPLFLAARAARDYLKNSSSENSALIAQLNAALVDPHVKQHSPSHSPPHTNS